MERKIEIALAQTPSGIAKIAPVLNQLRTQYSEDSLIEKISQLQLTGYQIAYAQCEGEVLCVAGFVVGESLAWGKHIYINDLVTNEQYRGSGAGSALLTWLKSYAKANNCQQIHLDSGVQRFAAHRFYLNNGFNIASHHFSITALD
ncbi:GNAT family N-acetyltransferase [Thalassotalea euphylliae]|uniref:GNAT family N-acetyltransferase n=1 Tax=Thalassotalea euphylliae TaxID=1655234 RepID=A0A3E0TWK3_9GAMM|nr:GNAT family N-acetyltransferase [Thalassotalea euphylliae]REL28978.1 GNAT family N-acetyltransferase [Thalassotalea euphylliae]